MVLGSLLNPVFGPLLNMSPLVAITIISFIIALVMIIVYKYTTNQVMMKEMRGQLKGYQKQIKESRSEPAKMSELNKKMMEINMKVFRHSMKSMLITWIPIIIIFGWMNAHLGYEPIMPRQAFTTNVLFEEGISGDVKLIVPEGVEILGNSTQAIKDRKAEWQLKGIAGNYILEYDFENEKVLKEILITKEKAYINPIITKKGMLSFGGEYIPTDSRIVQISVSNAKVYPLKLFGLRLSWFWTYFILTFIFNMALRKAMKVY